MNSSQWSGDCPLAPGVDPTSVRARVYTTLFVLTPGDRLARTVEAIISVLILVNVAALVLESIEEVRTSFGTALLTIETATLAIFTVEYLLRAWSITAARDYQRPVMGRLRYLLTCFALVDLISILPLYATLVGANLKVVSAARMLRLLKLGRYSSAMQSLTAVFVGKRREVFAAVLILVSLLLLASCGIYLAESDAQPEAFGSIPKSMWWSVITITTVGYGDVTPVTTMGKVFTGIIAVVGLLAVAIPTGIVSAGFFEEFKRRSLPTRCPHCGESMTS
jgi:voltage-gated potassium channel